MEFLTIWFIAGIVILAFVGITYLLDDEAGFGKGKFNRNNEDTTDEH
jgi:hypothetical protein